MSDAFSAHPFLGALGRQRVAPGGPRQLTFDAELQHRPRQLGIVQAADRHAHGVAFEPPVGERRAAAIAEAALDDIRASEERWTAARPAEALVFDARRGHERVAGRTPAHAAMANARVLGRREHFVAHGAALAAAGQVSMFVRRASHATSQMTVEIHALVQNSCNVDVPFKHAEKENVRAGGILTVADANVVARATPVWGARESPQCPGAKGERSDLLAPRPTSQQCNSRFPRYRPGRDAREYDPSSRPRFIALSFDECLDIKRASSAAFLAFDERLAQSFDLHLMFFEQTKPGLHDIAG